MQRFARILGIGFARVVTAALFCGFLLADLLIVSNGQEMPLADGDLKTQHEEEAALAWKLGAAQDALEGGFATLAVSLYWAVLDSPRLAPEKRQEVTLLFASGLVAAARFEEAREALDLFENREDPQYRLLDAILLYQSGNAEEAGEVLNALPFEQVNPSQRAWHFMIRGLIASGRQDFESAESFFQLARQSSVWRAQQTHFDEILFRNRLFSGRANEELATDLRSNLEANLGRREGFQYGKVYAVVLDELGRKDEAVALLEELLRFESVQEGDLEDQILLLLGLIAGESTAKGKQALGALLSKDGNTELQRVGLQLLLHQALDSSQTADVRALFNALIDRPINHALLDELYFLRAFLELSSNRMNQAEADANRLLELFPGSRLSNSALRLLAYTSWQRDPPHYRMAAGYLNRLRAVLPDGAEKAHITTLMADCYFLNEDYENATDAYATALLEAPRSDSRSTLHFQRVLSEIGAGRFDEAIAFLNDATVEKGVDPLTRWRAEWNLISKMKSGGQVEKAFERVSSLLSERDAALVPMDLRLRLMWLNAQLSLEARRLNETPVLCEQIIATLDEPQSDPIEPKLRNQLLSRTLLLQGQAYFALGLAEQGLVIFEKLGRDYGGSEPHILSYLTEARYYASVNRTVEAQQRLIDLADDAPGSEYAPIALWEAALNAEQRGISSTYEDALGILERLVRVYPEHDLVYYARLKQADLSRQLNAFGDALNIYELLINQRPGHPERYRAEISRADCLLAQASRNTASLEEAAAVLQRLVDLSNLPVDLRVEAGYKWGFAEEKKGRDDSAQEVYTMIMNRFLRDSEVVESLGARGRYWQARLIFQLGEIFEKQKQYAQAREIYSLVSAYGLPGQSLAAAKIERFSRPRN